MVIILMAISGYPINDYWLIFYCGYWWLLISIILMVIGEYFIMDIVISNEYFINGYWWLFYYGYWWLLMTIILMVIGEYSIGGY
jgi:hypothetical protein